MLRFIVPHVARKERSALPEGVHAENVTGSSRITGVSIHDPNEIQFGHGPAARPGSCPEVLT